MFHMGKQTSTNSDKFRKLIRGFCYALIFIPILFSIFYSVPASDDFAMALGRENSSGFFSELFSNMAYFFTKRGGTVIAFFIEFLINPLNAHVHLGHVYGLYMIVVFILSTVAIVYAIKVMVAYMLPEKSRRFVATITLIITAVLFTTFYYVESFNWFVGAIAYEVPMAMLLLSFAFIIKHTESPKTKYFVLMLITGIIAANNTVMDVPIGMFFLYVVYYKPGYNKFDIKGNLKKAIPLFAFIISGMVGVLAPGNFVRKTQYTQSVPVYRSAIQVLIDMALRTFRIIVDHPFTVLLFILLIYIGILSHEGKQKNTNPLLILVLGMIAQFGSLFPYVYARGFTDTNLAVRVQYVLDYLIEFTICFTCIAVGRWLSAHFDTDSLRVNKLSVAAVLAMFFYVAVVNNYAYLHIVQVDILKSKGIITSSYSLWDGILAEIENSNEENVVVTRDYNISWSPYFFYSGIDDGVVYNETTVYSAENIMPNVYYHKDSITLHIPEAK